MKNRDYPFFDVEVFANKRRVLIVFFAGIGLVAISIVCMIWSLMNWEEYSETCVYLLAPGSYHDCGFAPSLFNWALTFITLIPLIFFIIWMTLDIRRPLIGVNRKGIFINQRFFKQTFLSWDKFKKINKTENGALELYFLNPEKIVANQPVHFRFLLKTTYLKRKLPFVIEPDLKNLDLIDVVDRYWEAFGPDEKDF